MSTADEIRAERRPTITTQDLIISGEATLQQIDIDSAIYDLSQTLELFVPSSTMHYVVEDLRRAIKSYNSAPPIKTKDVK